MHVVIGGCGRVGSQLAAVLAGDGHDVAIIDKDKRSFRRLPDDFGGRRLSGVVFDRQTLEQAGIKQAKAFVAVTSGDNSNIVSARVARDRYDVDRVVARIYDPVRAAIFERIGVTTIATAQWTTEEVLRLLLPDEERIEAGIGPGAGDVALLAVDVPAGVHGVEAGRLNRPGRSVLTAITREGRTSVPVLRALLQAGDRLHVAVDRDHVQDVRDEIIAMVDEARD